MHVLLQGKEDHEVDDLFHPYVFNFEKERNSYDMICDDWSVKSHAVDFLMN